MKTNNKKFLSILIVVIVVISGFYLYYEFRSVNFVEVKVDFSLNYKPSDESFQYSERITPVYDTLNIWDISWFNLTWNDPGTYREKYYFIKKLVVMTATGGRDTGSNEYMTILPNGTVLYDFSPLESMVDWLKNASITPIFVIGNTPHALTPDPENIDYGAFGADTAEPKDYKLYYFYIRNLTQFLKEYAGASFISQWTWRIYTEPDNDDWLTGELEAYYRIYNSSARAIRSIIPDAMLELGNMMDKDLDSEHLQFIDKLAVEDPDIFPNVIGWSVYGNIRKDLFMREAFSLIRDWQKHIESLGFDNVEYVIEEGQILTDEEGRRLWLGDSTELGAAFTANAFTQCIYENISRYTTWDFYSCEIRTPKLNVIDMFKKMQGESVNDISFNWGILVKESKKTVNGICSSRFGSDGGDKAHILLYNLRNERDHNQPISIGLSINAIPKNAQQFKIYLIDGNYSNFHREWDEYAEKNNFSYCDVPGYGPGSPYDVALGMTLCEQYREQYYLWSWEHRLHDFGLDCIYNASIQSLLSDSDTLGAFTAGSFGLQIESIGLIADNYGGGYNLEATLVLNGNSVVLLEFD